MLHQYSKLRFVSYSLALLLTLTACGKMDSVPQSTPTVPQETTETDAANTDQKDSSLAQLRSDLTGQNVMGGILFLGNFQEPSLGETFRSSLEQQGYLSQYPFLDAIPQERIAKTEGDEVYCIVPADSGTSVEVRQWILDETGEHTGNLLYRSNSGEPFLIRGNISDIIPNMAISMIDRTGRSLSDYTPSISLKDGSIVLPGTEDAPLLMELPLP